jgi:hypothetical protein
MVNIERLKIESSVILLSIFTTVSLLFQATSQQFKEIYVLFGYMLYFSFPFIFTIILSVISLTSEELKMKDIMNMFSNSFFLAGFIMLLYLACTAAQTSMLPGSFYYIIPAESVIFFEFLFVLILFGAQATAMLIKPNYVIKHKNRIQFSFFCIGIILFLIGIVMISVGGVHRTEQQKANTLHIEGSPEYTTQYVNLTLNVTDQITVKITSLDGLTFHYFFMNEINFQLYQNKSTRISAIPEKGGYTTDASFIYVVETEGTYFLALDTTEPLGVNIAYEIWIYHVNNSNMNFFLCFIAFGVSCFFMVSWPKERRNVVQLEDIPRSFYE